jgi:hypothetical protein
MELGQIEEVYVARCSQLRAATNSEKNRYARHSKLGPKKKIP